MRSSPPTGRRLLCRDFIDSGSVLFEVDDCAVCSIKHHPSLQRLGCKSEDVRKELTPSGQLWPGVQGIALQDTQTPKRSLYMGFNNFSAGFHFAFSSVLFKAWIRHPITSLFSFAFPHSKNSFFQTIYLNYTSNLLIITLAPGEQQGNERVRFLPTQAETLNSQGPY